MTMVSAGFLLFMLSLAQESWSMAPVRDLYQHLLKDYNKLIRPVGLTKDRLTVYMGLKLTQLNDVDEKNQVITINVWVQQEWIDVNLQWNPSDFQNITQLYIPSENLWRPDIVLYNNADGNYELKIMTKASVFSNGTVRWMPPAIYQSSCKIDVKYFPFDVQTCKMKFGSWTYDGNQVNLKHIAQNTKPTQEGQADIEHAADMSEFYESVEWDILRINAMRRDNKGSYPCCPDVPFPDVTFIIFLRRKTLFYIVNLIVPCVALSFLTVLVFYLPSESGEKIVLSISILLSLTVFFMLLSETIPPNGVDVPLIVKYLLFTMTLVALSIIITVFILNVHFRSPDTHHMSAWTRRIFLEKLPKFLFMQRSPSPKEVYDEFQYHSSISKSAASNDTIKTKLKGIMDDLNDNCETIFHHIITSHDLTHSNSRATQHYNKKVKSKEEEMIHEKIKSAIDGVCYVAEHIKNDDKDASIREDWKYLAKVLDRFFLWIFFTACIIASFSILLQSPIIFDKRKPMSKTYSPTAIITASEETLPNDFLDDVE